MRKIPPSPSFTLKPLFLTILWTVVLFIIFFMSPTSPGIIPLFFVFLFVTLTFTFSVLLKNTRRSLTLTFAICFFLILRYFGLGNILNLLLLIGSLLAFEFFLSNRP